MQPRVSYDWMKEMEPVVRARLSKPYGHMRDKLYENARLRRLAGVYKVLPPVLPGHAVNSFRNDGQGTAPKILALRWLAFLMFNGSSYATRNT